MREKIVSRDSRVNCTQNNQIFGRMMNCDCKDRYLNNPENSERIEGITINVYLKAGAFLQNRVANINQLNKRKTSKTSLLFDEAIRQIILTFQALYTDYGIQHYIPIRGARVICMGDSRSISWEVSSAWLPSTKCRADYQRQVNAEYKMPIFAEKNTDH